MSFRLSYRIDGAVRRRALQTGENLVGSDPSCDVVIAHPSVSRHHAAFVIVEKDGAPTLEVADLGSRNGTRVDHQRLRGKTQVEAGSPLMIGSVEAWVDPVDQGDSVAAATAPGDEPRGPEATRADDRTEGIDGDASVAPVSMHTTASVGPLAVFVFGYLPGLVELLHAGKPRHVVAQRTGAALLEALPCRAVEMTEGEARSGLFRAETSGSGGTEARARVGDIDVRVDLPDEETAGLLQPLVETAAGLVASAGMRSSEGGSSPDASRGVTEATGAAEARPPDPPSVEPAVRTLYEQAARVAQGDVNVLIRGESGTGKELLARFIHASSPRADQPMVAMNCAALPKDLQESELFGIERGVATGVEERPGLFELADGGTLFLDEIGDMALEVQAKILRVLQEGEVFRIGGTKPRRADVRVLSATHRDVRDMLEEGDFRSDLFHRIADWQAELPALRERRGDIPNLAVFFLREGDTGGRAAGFTQAALDALRNHSWPGNIRQLEREIRRAALFVDEGELLDTSCLSAEVAESGKAPPAWTLKARLEQTERDAIRTTLSACGGDVGRAAEQLDVPVSTLYRRIKLLGVQED